MSLLFLCGKLDLFRNLKFWYTINDKERLPQFRKILQKRRHSRLCPAVPDMLQYFTGVL